MPLLASDTIAVLKHLHLSRPIHFFGGSMGGRIGFALATNPEFAKYFKTFIISAIGIHRVDIIQEFSKWAEKGGMPYVVEQMGKKFLEDSWPDISSELPRIDIPTFCIAGEYAVEYAELEQAVKLIKGAELRILPGLNHVQTYWGGDKVAPLIIELIKEKSTVGTLMQNKPNFDYLREIFDPDSYTPKLGKHNAAYATELAKQAGPPTSLDIKVLREATTAFYKEKAFLIQKRCLQLHIKKLILVECNVFNSSIQTQKLFQL